VQRANGSPFESFFCARSAKAVSTLVGLRPMRSSLLILDDRLCVHEAAEFWPGLGRFDSVDTPPDFIEPRWPESLRYAEGFLFAGPLASLCQTAIASPTPVSLVPAASARASIFRTPGRARCEAMRGAGPLPTLGGKHQGVWP
jgi:hypothetical protein